MTCMLLHPRLVIAGALLTLASSALAQEQTQPTERTQTREGAEAQPRTEPVIEGAPVDKRDYSSDEEKPQQPQPPENMKQLSKGEERMAVAIDAGVGSPLGYAKGSIVELGGSVSLLHASDTTTLTFLPTVGYFFVDGFQLTFGPELRIIHIDDDELPEAQSDFTIGGALEPSYHLAIGESYYVFGAAGVGVRYSEEPGFDLFFRPRVGLDILIGRSGIFKPALFMDIGVNDGVAGGGFEAGFTVML